MAGEKNPNRAYDSNCQQGSDLTESLDTVKPMVDEDDETLGEKKREQSRQILRQIRGQLKSNTATLHTSGTAVKSNATVQNPASGLSQADSRNTPPSVSNPDMANTSEAESFFDDLFAENVLKETTLPTSLPVKSELKEPPKVERPVMLPGSKLTAAPAFPVKSEGKSSVKPPPTSPKKQTEPVLTSSFTSEQASFGDEPATARFQPRTLSTAPEKYKENPTRSWLDIVGLVLEGLLILALAIIIGYFLIEQFGWFQPSYTTSNGSPNDGLTQLWSNGAVINVDAGSTFLNLPPATSISPTSTLPPFTATAVVAPVVQYTKSATQVVNTQHSPTFTPLVASTATQQPNTPKATVAPTLTPLPAPAPTVKAAVNGSGDFSQSPPTRIVIPRLGLDVSVKDVTVKLGSWQVADYAVGHNLGTANPGESGNMVLAGHRDIRGSVFLRLPELQKGDEFTVFSSAGAFRYSVNEIFEVAPNDISVMNPTSEAITTLITCTPLGTSNRRLIVRAKLVN